MLDNSAVMRSIKIEKLDEYHQKIIAKEGLDTNQGVSGQGDGELNELDVPHIVERYKDMLDRRASLPDLLNTRDVGNCALNGMTPSEYQMRSEFSIFAKQHYEGKVKLKHFAKLVKKDDAEHADQLHPKETYNNGVKPPERGISDFFQGLLGALVFWPFGD